MRDWQVIGAVKDWNDVMELVLKGAAVITVIFVPLLRYQYNKLKDLIESTYSRESELLEQEVEIHRDVLMAIIPHIKLDDGPAALTHEKFERLKRFIRDHKLNK